MARRKGETDPGNGATVPSWLSAGLVELSRAESAARTLAQIDTADEACRELQDCVSKLEHLEPAVTSGRKSGWLPAAMDVGFDLSTLEDIVQNGTSRQSLPRIRSLDAVLQELTYKTASAWADHVRRTAGDVDDLLALAEVLDVVPAMRTTVSSLKAGLSTLSRLAGRLPGPRSDEQLATAAEQITSALGKVGNESVRIFLLRASTGAATLDLINDEVVDWLSEHGATDLVRIRLGRNQ